MKKLPFGKRLTCGRFFKLALMSSVGAKVDARQKCLFLVN